jgi:hypothetical protein
VTPVVSSTTWTAPTNSPGDQFQLTATGESSQDTAHATFAGLTTYVYALPTDYLAGATANIFGGGFQAGETVDFQVTNETDGSTYAPWTATADTDGSVQTGWVVATDAANSTLQITATGESPGLTAQNTFTDATSGTLAVGPSTVLAGTTRTYALTVTSTNGKPAGNNGNNIGEVQFTVPSGFTVSSSGLHVGTTEGTSWTVSASGNVITTIESGTLSSSNPNQLHDGQTLIVDATFTAPVTAQSTNWTAQTYQADGSNPQPTNTSTVAVTTSTSPSHSATASPSTVSPGALTTFTLQLTNTSGAGNAGGCPPDS